MYLLHLPREMFLGQVSPSLSVAVGMTDDRLVYRLSIISMYSIASVHSLFDGLNISGSSLDVPYLSIYRVIQCVDSFQRHGYSQQLATIPEVN